MARSSIWDGTQWVSMTGGAGEDGGGGEPDDTFLRLDASNNNASPNNFLRTVDADLLYLKLSGGTLSGALRINAPDHEGLLVKGGGSVGSGGAVLFGADQGNHFASITGFLQDGGNNTRGDLQFFTRFISQDANLTLVLTMESSGVSVFEKPIHVKESTFGVAHYRLDDDAFRASPVFDRTVGAAGNVNIGTGGILSRSLAILFAASSGEEATMDTRIGQSFFDNSLEAIDLAALVNHVLDLIDDLKDRIETLEP